MSWLGKLAPAHRIAYMLTHDDMEQSLDVLHRCDNPQCCNPSHLFQGTHTDNMRDKVWKGRSPDLRGRNNGRAKVTESDVRAIRAAYRQGETQTSIANRYGLNQTSVSQIVRRTHWGHIPD